MKLIEFNNLPLSEKYSYIFTLPSIGRGRFISFRKDGELMVSLWDLDSFFAEIYYSHKIGKVLKVEGFALTDDRINLYIDYFLEVNEKEVDLQVELA